MRESSYNRLIALDGALYLLDATTHLPSRLVMVPPAYAGVVMPPETVTVCLAFAALVIKL